jgi:hypothetical protein
MYDCHNFSRRSACVAVGSVLTLLSLWAALSLALFPALAQAQQPNLGPNSNVFNPSLPLPPTTGPSSSSGNLGPNTNPFTAPK